MERRRARHGRHWSLGRRDVALPKIMENQVPLKVFLWDSVPQNITFYHFPPGQAVRWEVSQCLARSCDGDLGIHQAGLTPLSYRNPLLTSSWILDPKGIPASGKLRNTACTQSHRGAFTTGVWELVCSGPCLPCVSRVREGFLHSLVSREAEHIQLWQFKMSAN